MKLFISAIAGGIFLMNSILGTPKETYEAAIAVGSTNPLKIQSVKNAAGKVGIKVIGCSAASKVRIQPLTEEETREGAVNRAKDSLSQIEAELGIGLEAGVFFLNDQVYLCHWGALVDRNDRVFLTNGPIILLPSEYREKLLAGQSLEEIMHHSTGIENLGKKEGAIGIFTENRLNREQVLTDIVKVLLAQYRYYTMSGHKLRV
jgi:inosine/xanthosine triphosphatase